MTKKNKMRKYIEVTSAYILFLRFHHGKWTKVVLSGSSNTHTNTLSEWSKVALSSKAKKIKNLLLPTHKRKSNINQNKKKEWHTTNNYIIIISYSFSCFIFPPTSTISSLTITPFSSYKHIFIDSSYRTSSKSQISS